MNRKPLTKKQAEKIALKYQYLIGKRDIAYVTIAPFDIDNHLNFASWYHMNEELADSEYPNPSGEYGVFAIVNPADSGDFYMIPYEDFSEHYKDLL